MIFHRCSFLNVFESYPPHLMTRPEFSKYIRLCCAENSLALYLLLQLRGRAMEQKMTVTLKRVDAEALIKCLQHRQERLCDIKREICPAETADPFEHEQCGS